MSKRYPKELRARIVEEYRQGGRSIRELANDYEPGETTIRKGPSVRWTTVRSVR